MEGKRGQSHLSLFGVAGLDWLVCGEEENIGAVSEKRLLGWRLESSMLQSRAERIAMGMYDDFNRVVAPEQGNEFWGK